jgi:hypothetical protein
MYIPAYINTFTYTYIYKYTYVCNHGYILSIMNADKYIRTDTYTPYIFNCMHTGHKVEGAFGA